MKAICGGCMEGHHGNDRYADGGEICDNALPPNRYCQCAVCGVGSPRDPNRAPPPPAAPSPKLPTDAAARKAVPLTTGVLDYFPLALAEIARVSKAGNDQHNPGQPLHWDRSKSTDHANCIGRHLLERGTIDTDGMRHSAKLAWRALANLQVELEAAAADPKE